MVFENVPRKIIIVNSTPHPKDVIDEIRKCYASLLIFRQRSNNRRIIFDHSKHNDVALF